MNRCNLSSHLSAYLGGKLDDDVLQATIETHITHCETCLAVLDTLTDDDDELISAIRSGQDDPISSEDRCREAVESVVKLAASAPSASAAEVLESTSLGPYEILERLGSGGAGTVYKARHSHLGKTVALKVLRVTGTGNATGRFLREMKAVGGIAHPHVVQATDGGVDDEGVHYFVMECLNGVDLSELSRQHGPLSVADACELVRQAAVGLQHIHEHGMVHRDIKPRNLMLAKTGGDADSCVVKILDLGLATFSQTSLFDEASLTDTGQVMGTLDYMAPEQGLDSRDVDIRADVYSLGATLYKLLCGHAPFQLPEYHSFGRKFNAVLNETAPSIGEIRDDLPAGLVQLVNQMLHRNPARRPQTPVDVAEKVAEYTPGHELPHLLSSKLAGDTAQFDGNTLTSFDVPTTTPVAKLAKSFDLTQKKLPQVYATFATNVAPESLQSAGQRKMPPILKLALATGGALALLLGTVLYISFGKGTLKVEINDDNITAVVRDGEVKIKTGDEPIRLRPGDHSLIVKRGDLEFTTDSFSLKRGTTTTLNIEYINGEISVVDASGRVLGQETEPSVELGGDLLTGNNSRQLRSDDATDLTNTEAQRNRVAAEWILAERSCVQVDGNEHWIETIDHLPQRRFLLTGVCPGADLINEQRQDTSNFEKIALLNGLQKLERLHFQCGMHDAALETLSNLPALRILELNGDFAVPGQPRITDQCVNMIKRYPKLELLSLSSTDVTDAGIAELLSAAEMQRLREVYLGRTVVSVRGIAAATKLPELQLLRLEDCRQLSSEAFVAIGDSPVRILNLHGNRITASDIESIARMPRLEVLHLGATNVRAEWLAPLADVETLKEIYLDLTGIGDDGKELILATFPMFEFRPEYDKRLVRKDREHKR